MSCNKDTKKCELKKGDKLNECCINNMLEILVFIDKIFNEHKISYWLDYGTLLGAVREGDIINYDRDCDIGILRQDADKLLSLSNEFRLNDLQVVPWFYPDLIRIDYSRINELHVDVFIWDIEKLNFKQLWEDESQYVEKVCLTRKDFHPQDNIKGKWFPISFLFPFQKINLNNHQFICPKDPEDFVKFRYGLDWKQPKVYAT